MELERRIKKHIYAKNHDFFIITQLGFEDITLSELNNLGFNGVKDVGGINFNGKIEDLYSIALNIRTSSKILMRLSSFYATHVSELINNFKKINLELFFKENEKIKFHISSKSSKLYHLKMIEEVLSKVLKENDAGFQIDDSAQQKIYIKFEENICTISLDATGELLHKRFEQKHMSEAPIRETIASFLLLKYWNKEEYLIDSMCGSGTFSIEAAMIKNNISPNMQRTFNFKEWVNFKEATFNFLLNKCQNNILNNDLSLIFTSDIDDNRIKEAIFNKNMLKLNLNPVKLNFFDIIPPQNQTGLVILNPPYGKRIEKSDNLYDKIFYKLKKDFKGWKYVVLIPKDIETLFSGNNYFEFSNGGIEIKAYNNIK